MAYSRNYDRLARTIGSDDEEKKVQTSFRLNESVVASVSSIAKATGVSKTEILNQVLTIGLTELCEALQATRTDLIVDVVESSAQPVYDFFSPVHFQAVRNRFGDALQLDLEDAINDQEALTQENEEEDQ